MRQRTRQAGAAQRPRQVDLAVPHFDPLEKRDVKGQWTKDETRTWLSRHPVAASNVVDMWDQGTPGEHEAGEVWYPNAHKVAVALAARNKVSVREAAGLLANYSPQTAWGQNITTAAEALREHRPIGGPKARIYWHRDPSTPNDFEASEGIMATAVAEKRSRAIEAGQDFEDVFAGGRNKDGSLKPSSLKIRAFGELIANGVNDPAHPRVVIDRHAAGVARGVRMTEEDYSVDGPSSSAKKFDSYATAYEEAAKQISAKEGRTVPPEAVQAATWLTRQRLNGAMLSQVGKTRKALGKKDTDELKDYVEQYLPEALGVLPKTGYANLATPTNGDIDIRPRASTKVRVRATPSTEGTVDRIAKVFLASRRGRRLSTKEETLVLRRLLKPHGIELPALQAALAMTQNEAGDYRGTANAPNARLAAHGLAEAKGSVADVRDQEVYYRASYVANAAQRMQDAINAGETTEAASVAERRYYAAHELARKGRLNSAAQVQSAAALFGSDDGTGVLVGWYLNPLLHNDPECVAANGHNFYADRGTVIGLPGSVHARCGCYAGQPHYGATLVNEALGNVSRLHGTTAKFKIRRAA